MRKDDVIERLEKAMGADEALDRAIAVASGHYTEDRIRRGSMLAHKDSPNIWGYGIPTYTASIDAALTLVPEGSSWMVSTEEPGPYAAVGETTCAYMAATPALAICIAALKARHD